MRNGIHFTRKMTQLMKSHGVMPHAAIDAMSDVVSVPFARASGEGREFRDVLTETARGTIQSAKEAGIELAIAANGFMVGVLRGTLNSNRETLETIGSTSSKLVEKTAEVGGDIESTTRGAIEGAIESAKHFSVSRDEAASAAFVGAIEAAYEIDDRLAESIREKISLTRSQVTGSKTVGGAGHARILSAAGKGV